MYVHVTSFCLSEQSGPCCGGCCMAACSSSPMHSSSSCCAFCSSLCLPTIDRLSAFTHACRACRLAESLLTSSLASMLALASSSHAFAFSATPLASHVFSMCGEWISMSSGSSGTSLGGHVVSACMLVETGESVDTVQFIIESADRPNAVARLVNRMVFMFLPLGEVRAGRYRSHKLSGVQTKNARGNPAI